MGTAKVVITLDDETLRKLDLLVKKQVYRNRSKAIQEAVQDKLKRLEKTRLARECSKLDPSYEKRLADEGISEDGKEMDHGIPEITFRQVGRRTGAGEESPGNA